MRIFARRERWEKSFKVCFCYCLIDILLALFVGTLCWLLFTDVIPPYKRGFYCNDPSIRLPFKPGTVSLGHLMTVAMVTPVLLIIWYQLWNYWMTLRPNYSTADSNNSAIADRIRATFTVGTSIAGEYFFGLVIVLALMQFGKSCFGVLRPHFIDVCQPNTNLTTCRFDPNSVGGDNGVNSVNVAIERVSDEMKIVDDPSYIVDPHCTTKDRRRLEVARKSFPSGHAAVAVYSWLFIICFVRDRSQRAPSVNCCPALLVKYTFGTVYTAWTMWVCISRVTDNWHHWTDVAGGVALALAVGSMLLFRKDSTIRTSNGSGKTCDY